MVVLALIIVLVMVVLAGHDAINGSTGININISTSSNTNTSIGLVVIEGLEVPLLQCCTSVHGEPPFDY